MIRNEKVEIFNVFPWDKNFETGISERLAHSLKGAAGNLRILGNQVASKALEQAWNEGEANIETQLEAVVAELMIMQTRRYRLL